MKGLNLLGLQKPTDGDEFPSGTSRFPLTIMLNEVIEVKYFSALRKTPIKS